MKRALACDYRFEFNPQDCWIGVIVLGFVIVAIIRALKGD
jgi:hypothetical protein